MGFEEIKKSFRFKDIYSNPHARLLGAVLAIGTFTLVAEGKKESLPDRRAAGAAILGTELPADGKLEKLTADELYPHLRQFYQNSLTFKNYWDKSLTVERSGAQCLWNSIADNSCMVVQSYDHLIKDDDEWFFTRCPHLTPDTYQKVKSIAKEIHRDSEWNKLFHLMMYARDFGWAKTGQGQFHQTTGKPILKTILQELDYAPEEIDLYVSWQGDHSMPAEMFLGEVSQKSAEDFIAKYGRKKHNLLPMVALLSFFEVNCIRQTISAAYEENTFAIMQLADEKEHEIFLKDLYEKRIERLSSSEMKNSKTPLDKQLEIAERTLQRKEIMQKTIASYSQEERARIERFLREVDLHYIAATFPKMSPEAIARFLKISANLSFPEIDGPIQHYHVINMRQDKAAELDAMLLTVARDEEIEEKYISVNRSDDWLVWDPSNYNR